MQKTILLVLSLVFMVPLVMVCLARPIRGSSATSSEEFPDSGLPYDAEVEYIESTGTQYIDTGLKAGRGYTFQYHGAGASGTISCAFGGGEANNINEFIVYFYNNTSYVRNGTSNSINSAGYISAQDA